jgi:mRNA-degrading endonuclease RelE of RelBE toxin-antitoxin system
MRKIIILPSFERSMRKLNASDKIKLAESLEQLNNFVFSGELPIGLGFKKIGPDKYEFRSGLRLRILVKFDENIYYLSFVGNHDEIKRYLRRYR